MSPPVRVGVADSGINPRHLHVGSVSGGVGIRVRDGAVTTDDAWEDLLGHGTAAAATIRGHAPAAELFAIRIFRRRLEAHVEALLHAIRWAAEHELDLLNLSLGCTRLEWRPAFVEALREAERRGLNVVAAREADGRPSLPGILDTVIAVRPDPEIEGSDLRSEEGVFYASSWARPLRELPRERNFHGASLAVAHVTGIAARLLAERKKMRPGELFAALRNLAG